MINEGPLEAISNLPNEWWDVGASPIDYGDNSWFAKKVLEPLAGIYATRKAAEFGLDKLKGGKFEKFIKHAFPWGYSRIAPTPLRAFSSLDEIDKYNNRGWFRKTLGDIFNIQRGLGISPTTPGKWWTWPLRSPAFRGGAQTGILGATVLAAAPYLMAKANELGGVPKYPSGHPREGELIYSTKDYDAIYNTQDNVGAGYAAGQVASPTAPYEDRIMRMARNEAQGPRNNYQGL